jgi:phosphatidylglycerol:prolipoprotein diacylglycerol transferase
MFFHPQFDPIALQIGPLAVRWYGLMYLLAFGLFLVLGRLQLRRAHVAARGWSRDDLDDLLFAGVLGVVLGGRLGYVLFYKPMFYLDHPLDIFKVWEGGMSFHGGFLGVLCAMFWFAARRRRSFLEVTDFIAPLIPGGLAAGRMGNFINGELWGRVTDGWWGTVFPQAGDGLARHPSQLYQFALEGLALWVLLWWYARSPRPVGAVSAVFLMGYGLFRFIAEFAREPDDFLGLLTFGFSMGQWLSVPMILGGAFLLLLSRRRAA